MITFTIPGTLRRPFHPLAPIPVSESNTPDDRVLRILKMAPASVSDLSRLTGIGTTDMYVICRRLANAHKIARLPATDRRGCRYAMVVK